MAETKRRVSKRPKRVRKQNPAEGQKLGRLIPALFVAGGLMFIVFGFVYYYQVFTKPSNVFWGMIENNLSTGGLTRQVIQKGSDQTSNEVAKFNFGTPTAVKLSRTLTSNDSPDNFTKLEGIGTAETDYQRYVEVGRADDSNRNSFDNIAGKWVQTGSGAEGASQQQNILLRALLGPVLSGNLPAGTRQQVINEFKFKNVYKIDFNDAPKAKYNGHNVRQFKAEINLKAFTEVMAKYAFVLGIPGAETINPESYDPNETIKAVLLVDVRSRQLLKIDYADSNINETYSGYGVKSDITAPSEYLSSEQFQQLLSQ